MLTIGSVMIYHSPMIETFFYSFDTICLKTYVRVSQTLRRNCSSLFVFCSKTNSLFKFLDIEYAFSMHLEEVP